MRRMKIMMVVVACIIALAGCSSPPRQELADAEQALRAAESAGAEMFAREAFRTASETLRAAKDEVSGQNTKSRLKRDYDKAKELATGAKAKADAAAEEARAKGKTESERAQAEAQLAVGNAKASIEKAPKGLKNASYLEARQQAFATALEELKIAQADFAGGNQANAFKGFTAIAAGLRKAGVEVDRTSQGFLVDIERKQSEKYRVYFLTTSGLQSEDETLTAGPGMILLVLHFSGDERDVPEGHFWLGDSSGNRHGHETIINAEAGRLVVYKVPVAASGWIWHDGDLSYELVPIREISAPTPPQDIRR